MGGASRGSNRPRPEILTYVRKVGRGIRKTRWSEFLKSYWESLAAIDFFTHEIYTLSGLTRHMALVSIHYATRQVEVVGIIQQAHGQWMSQKARNLVDQFSGFP